jgi:hypothetical protein
LTALPAYLSGSPVLRASGIKSSGIKGVVIAHGLLDGEVSVDNSVQMAAALALAAVPTDVYTSLFKTPGTGSGLTLDGDVLGLVLGYESPFAGHVNDVVMKSALNALSGLYLNGKAPAGVSATLVDGSLGTIPLLHAP